MDPECLLQGFLSRPKVDRFSEGIRPYGGGMELLVAAFSAAFVLSALDYVRNFGWVRMPVAAVVAAASLALLGSTLTWSLLPLALACAFAALSSIVAVDRLTLVSSLMRRTR